MTIKKQLQDDVMGELRPRPIPVFVCVALLRKPPSRLLVQRIHFERFGVRPDSMAAA